MYASIAIILKTDCDKSDCDRSDCDKSDCDRKNTWNQRSYTGKFRMHVTKASSNIN